MGQQTDTYLEFRTRFVKPIERRETWFSGWFAVTITRVVDMLWCTYAFACLALVSLPQAIRGSKATLAAWTAQTFLQLLTEKMGPIVRAGSKDSR
jgi:hypothetical protein